MNSQINLCVTIRTHCTYAIDQKIWKGQHVLIQQNILDNRIVEGYYFKSRSKFGNRYLGLKLEVRKEAANPLGWMYEQDVKFWEYIIEPQGMPLLRVRALIHKWF